MTPGEFAVASTLGVALGTWCSSAISALRYRKLFRSFEEVIEQQRSLIEHLALLAHIRPAKDRAEYPSERKSLGRAA